MVAVCTIGIAGCSGSSGAGRSSATQKSGSATSSAPDDYCSIFYGMGNELRRQSRAAGSDPIRLMVLVLSSPQQLASFFQRLEAVAPDEVKSDLVVLHDSFQRIASAVNGGQPIEVLLAGLTTSPDADTAAKHVDNYTLRTCGPPPTEPNPNAGTTGDLFTNEAVTATAVSGSYLLFVTTSGSGASASTNARVVDSFGNSLANIPIQADSGTFKFCDVELARTPNGAGLVLLESLETTPAQGLTPASSTMSLTAYGAISGTELWETRIPQSGGCSTGELRQRSTADRSSGLLLVRGYTSGSDRVIDLQSGRVLVSGTASALLGHYVLAPHGVDGQPNPNAWVEVRDALAGGRVVGQIRNAFLAADLAGPYLENIVVVDGGNTAVTTKTDPQGKDALVAYRLPSGKQAWSLHWSALTTSMTYELHIAAVDDTGNVLILTNAAGDTNIAGVLGATGKIKWKLPESASFCTLYDSRLYAMANEQFVSVSDLTGQQLAFDSTIGSCPNLVGTFMVTSAGSATSVTRSPI
jgi:hypothetical protein